MTALIDAHSSFSALKMDGKPLYEYARSGTPLPRPIPSRKVTVHSLELLSFKTGAEHEYEWPKESLDETARKELEKLEKMVKDGATVLPKDEELEAGAEPSTAQTTEAQDAGASKSSVIRSKYLLAGC